MRRKWSYSVKKPVISNSSEEDHYVWLEKTIDGAIELNLRVGDCSLC